MAQSLPPLMTEVEYLALERASDEKHDFVDGYMISVHGDPMTGMAGASFEHNRIVARIIATLENALSGACVGLPSDMKVKVEATGRFYYPDATIACEPRFVDERRDALTNPRVIFEVLSPSTEDRDRGHKFVSYRRIPTFTDYVLCSSTEPLVEHHTREPDGFWRMREYGPNEEIGLPGLGITLAVNELYLKVFR